jgi:hypothetical protein
MKNDRNPSAGGMYTKMLGTQRKTISQESKTFDDAEKDWLGYISRFNPFQQVKHRNDGGQNPPSD